VRTIGTVRNRTLNDGPKPFARASGGPLAYEANVSRKMSVIILLSLTALHSHVNTQCTVREDMSVTARSAAHLAVSDLLF
jgi:hypothetical protein